MGTGTESQPQVPTLKPLPTRAGDKRTVSTAQRGLMGSVDALTRTSMTAFSLFYVRPR